MPLFTTTIENVSPLIVYEPSNGWVPGSSTNDSLASMYSGSSFTVSSANGASASFTFNGTGVQLFGARRGNHGFYQIDVDGNPLNITNGHANDPGVFQTSLFSTTNLQQGLHTVTLTNQGNTFVDIDFITWQTNLGTDSERLAVNTFQDGNPSFDYQPASSWTTNPDKIGTFMAGSGHETTVLSGASVVYTFTGAGVSIFGPVAPNSSPYAVQLDDGAYANFSATFASYTPQMMLYHANNLEYGRHTVKIQNQPTSVGQMFAIDYANVYTTPSLSAAAPDTAGSKGKRLSGGAIGGIVISIAAVLAILLGFFLFIRRRKLRRASLDGNQMFQPNSSQNGLVTPAILRPRLERNTNSINETVVIPEPYYTGSPTDTIPTTVSTFKARRGSAGHQLSSGVSSTSQSEHLSSHRSDYQSSGAVVAVSSPSARRSNSTSPKVAQQGRSGKGRPVYLGSPAGPSLDRREEERPGDSGIDLVVDGEQAPPDYLQATEPFDARNG